ncbi:MAG: site-specific DNA-methyltransferase [Chitinophagales bacterium]|nr:site-specific DNA-methyltransferase [Chitinophagales bacterium]
MPIKYIPYYPNTVEGQAILDNITRTQRVLRYRENDKVYDRIKRGMPYYEVETLETVGGSRKDAKTQSEGENLGDSATLRENLVIRGECISACAYLKEKGIKVDLVYIDPPFASGADYAKKVYLRRNPKLAEKIAAAEQEMDIDELKAFEEKMYGDIWQKEDYLNWMYENLMAIKSVMSDNAMIFFYIDYHIGHYVKILMDEVFGEDNFRNEIIVKRITKNLQRQFEQINALPQGHDSMFLYTNNNSVSFDAVLTENPNFELKPDGYWKDFWNNADRPTMRYEILGIEPTSGQWKWSKERALKALLNFQEYEKSFSTAKTLKEYWEETEKKLEFIRKSPSGKIEHWIKPLETKFVDTLWSDISAYANGNKQYATEKSEALLDRIIGACSQEEMVIADFFGGSGVTAKVANDLGRRFIHVDVGINSIQTVRDRLIESFNARQNAKPQSKQENLCDSASLRENLDSFQILEIKDGVSLFRNPQQTMDKLATLIPGLQKGVKGISNFWFGAISESKKGIVPVYVPNLLNTQEKVLDIPTINTIINQELQNLEVNAKKVIVYYIDIDDQKEVEKFIKDNNATEIEVELKDLKNLLHDIVIEDIIDFKLCDLASLRENEKEHEIEITKFTSDRLIQKIGEFNQKGNLQSIAKGKTFNPISISEEGLEFIELIALDCENTEGQWHSSTEIKIDKLGYVIKDGVKSKEFWDGKIISDKKPLRIKVRNISGDETIKTIE